MPINYAPVPGKIPGIPVNLGGHVFVLAPLGIKLARVFAALVKEAMDAKAGDDAYTDLNVDMIHASVQRNYPEVERDTLLELLDNGNIVEALEAISGQSGLKRAPPGEVAAGS